VRRRIRLFVLLTFLSFGLLSQSIAAPADEPLTLVTDLWPPFRLKGESEDMTGIDIDLTRLLEKRLGVTIKIVRVPWVRALQMMRSGQADLMAGLARTAEREQFIYYCEPPYSAIRPAFYKLAGNAAQLNTYEDLRNYSIGFTRASVYFEPFDSDKELKKQSASTEEQLLKMLLGQRFDFLVGSDIQVDYEIKLQGLGNSIAKAAYQPDKTTPLFFGISRQSRFLKQAPELEKALAGLLNDGSVTKLISQYTRPATATRQITPAK
jgi:polar amino acid transport system substrate-binding protein